MISVDIGATHTGHALDRIYTSEPLYSSTKVISATIKTAHKAVVAKADCSFIVDLNKSSTVCSLRSRTPSQHARFLSNLQITDFSFIFDINDLQLAVDKFYNLLNYLLNEYYPCRQVTVTSRDPPFVTPHVKLMLREKNKLLKRGLIYKRKPSHVVLGKKL